MDPLWDPTDAPIIAPVKAATYPPKIPAKSPKVPAAKVISVLDPAYTAR